MSLKDATKLFKLAVKDKSEDNFNTALGNLYGSDKVLAFKIPFELLPSEKTKDVMPYVKEFGLDDPQKLTEFLVELHFACFDSVNTNIFSVRKELLDEVVSKIDSVKKLVHDAENNPASAESTLTACVLQLSEVTSSLKFKINAYIEEIKKVDNRDSFTFFLKSRVDLSKVDAAVGSASYAIMAYFEALFILSTIGVRLNRNVSSYINEAEKYIQSLSDDEKISLMYAYDKDQANSVWSSQGFKNKIEEIKAVTENLQEVFEDEDVDLEDVEF